jgi:hypothetical protein
MKGFAAAFDGTCVVVLFLSLQHFWTFRNFVPVITDGIDLRILIAAEVELFLDQNQLIQNMLSFLPQASQLIRISIVPFSFRVQMNHLMVFLQCGKLQKL